MVDADETKCASVSAILLFLLLAGMTLCSSDAAVSGAPGYDPYFDERETDVPKITTQAMSTHDESRPDLNQVAELMDVLLLKQHYNKADSPSRPTWVQLGVHINNFDSISEQTMDYSVNLYLRQEWRDPRLIFGHLSNLTVIKADDGTWNRIWVPDVFFRNEKHAKWHSITTPNRLLWIYADGTVYYSSKITITMSCPMNLRTYPLDRQICSMEMESFGHTSELLEFIWRKDGPVEHKDESKLNLMEFRFVGFQLRDCSSNYSTGRFPCLQVDFILKRDIGYYMIQLYIPTVLVVILSWVAFWISDDAVPARVTIGLLTVLTMTTMSSGARATLPRVSYVKAVDVWLCTCLLFVFGSLIEFAVVNVYSRKRLAEQSRGLMGLTRSFANPSSGGGLGPSTGRHSVKTGKTTESTALIDKPIAVPGISPSHMMNSLSPGGGNQLATVRNRFLASGGGSTGMSDDEPRSGTGEPSSNCTSPRLAVSRHLAPPLGSLDETNLLRTPPEATKLRCALQLDPHKDQHLRQRSNTMLNAITRARTPPPTTPNPETGPGGALKKPSAIDAISRIAFPMSFLVFNFVYWIVYVFIMPQEGDDVFIQT